MGGVGLVLAVGIGLSLGLIGSGGSILAVPILIYVMGVAPQSAIAMSLAIVGIVSLIGVIPHAYQGNVNLKTALMFAPPAMAGAYLGARLATLPLITPNLQIIAFAIMMAIAAMAMIRKSTSPPIHLGATPDLPVSATEAADPPPTHRHWHKIMLEGLLVGIVTGFVGIGGGFLIIPALVLLGNNTMPEAVGTSLLIIAFKAATGFVGYVGQVPLDWPLMGSFTAAASLGTFVGAILSHQVQTAYLEKGFGYFILIVGLVMLAQHGLALHPAAV